MQFSVVNQPKNGAATLFVCTEANQLNNENAKIVFQSLGEKDSFASANLIVAFCRFENRNAAKRRERSRRMVG